MFKDVYSDVSDSWRVSPHVTFDYGVRYSIFLNPYASDNRIASFDPSHFSGALGNDPYNGLLIAPGTDWCHQAGNKGNRVWRK